MNDEAHLASNNDMAKERVVYFRPHHFMCALGFQGAGYSEAFVDNFKQTLQQIQSSGTVIEVAAVLDDICEPCPHAIIGVGCKQQEKIERLDKRHAQMLDLVSGDRLTWPQVTARIRERVTLDQFHKACDGCQWKPYGWCEAALRDLLGE